MFNSPFPQNEEPSVSDNAEIIFVADVFAEEYQGGAELTSQALLDSSPFLVQNIKCRDLTYDLLQKYHDRYWVFGNFASLDFEMIPTIVANLSYSVLEYDYKYCKWRSPEKHAFVEKKDCDCCNDINGKLVSAFLYGAQSLFWMSERQMERYHSIFPFLSEKPNTVISSVFGEEFWLARKILEDRYKDIERKGWIVLGSASWIKGREAAEEWCKKNDKEYEVVWGLPYDEMLERLAQAEGLVYLPPGGDTCPRMVIEAKLLGCKIHINDNVEHASEPWFDTDDEFDTEAYLYAARELFWNSIKAAMEWNPKLSGYTTTLNCLSQGYPIEKCVRSLLELCDEVIVVDGGSDDGTLEKLNELSKEFENLFIFENVIDMEHPRFAVEDGRQKAYARSKCTGDFCWQQDADEIILSHDSQKVRQLIRAFPSAVDLISLPIVEFWGGYEKVRLDVNPWKWRLSRNRDNIIHGIPGPLRKYDENGNLYASPGTDGCDYIDSKSHDAIAHVSFYNEQAHELRVHALQGNTDALGVYQEWFQRNIELLPTVYHYSWFDLPRKIRIYRDYWSSHWQSLYDIPQDDTAKNNMFFQRPWADVSEDDIDELALLLKEKMGGWIFHAPVDFDKPTPHMTLGASISEINQ